MSEAPIDISALVENIRSHRFDGYGPARIADEIDRFRSGSGTGSLTGAVDALEQVDAALTETDETLRAELGKLGVSWHGAASESASSAVAEEAGFSRQMAATLGGAARSLFAQGDAFNRTRDKLPSSDDVRNAMGGTNLGDDLMSLIGFETDHAEQVAKAREATQHAVQVLNEYATESGNNLGSVEAGTPPRTLGFSVAPGTPGAANARAAPVSGMGVAPPVGEDAATVPAGAVSSPEGIATPSASTAAPSNASASVPPPTPTAAGAGAEPPTPPAGLAALGSGGSGSTEGYASADDDSSTTTAAAAQPASPAAPGASSSTAGGVTTGMPATGAGHGHAGSAYGGPGGQAGAAERSGGRAVGRVTVSTPGVQAPAAGVSNKSYTRLTPLSPGSGAQDEPLARGRMSGLAAQPSSGGVTGGSYAARAGGGIAATDLGAGAAAIGAGGAAGAMSGEGDRHGRGVGRSAPNAGKSGRQLPFGAGPGEDEAEAAERIESDMADEPDGGF